MTLQCTHTKSVLHIMTFAPNCMVHAMFMYSPSLLCCCAAQWVVSVQLGTNSFFVNNVLGVAPCGHHATMRGPDQSCVDVPCSCVPNPTGNGTLSTAVCKCVEWLATICFGCCLIAGAWLMRGSTAAVLVVMSAAPVLHCAELLCETL